MTLASESNMVAASIRVDVEKAVTGTKRLKLRTLLSKFGYAKRSDSNTSQITLLLSAEGLTLTPPIVRLGDSWENKPEDWVYVSANNSDESPPGKIVSHLPPTWNADGWFDRLECLELRTEKEVEIKFIVPLLTRLGYSDNDRYDGMPVPAAHGSRDTTLVIDFALFNSSLESLRNQPLLTVEAKRENRLTKQRELLSAHNQAKSYCLWTQCDFFLITDSRTIQAFHIARGRLGELAPLFACERHQLSSRFGELYAIFSKEVLTRHYLNKIVTTEEAT